MLKNQIIKAANGIKMRNYQSHPMPRSYTKVSSHNGLKFPLYMNDAPVPSQMQQAFIDAVMH